MDRLLHENPDKYKCFLKDNEVRFEFKIGGNTLSYTLSGHPYAPTFIAKCDDEIYSYSEEGGLWFPDVDSDWSGFCEELAVKLNVTYMLKAFPNMLTPFQMAYKQVPNTQGIFKKQDNWYVYQTDERNNVDIIGPFDKNEIIYATAISLHLSDHFKEYEFSKDARNRYIHNHFRSIEEIDKNTMTFDEKILEYKESDKDKQLSEIALTIIEAYNGSYKPHIFDGLAFHNSENYYDIKHTDEGYSLIYTKAEKQNPSRKRVSATDKYFSDFVEHVFLVLAGNTEVKWKDVCESDAVIHALGKHFGIKVDLSYTGYYAALKSDVATHPTIWATVDLKANPDAWTTMEEKGFDYFDRNIWMIEL